MHQQTQTKQLPKGWKEEKLGNVCIINPSKAEVKNLDENFEVSFIPMAYVSEDGRIISMDKRHLKEVNKGFTFFKNGDVLLAKITPCFENGKKAIAEGLTNGIGFGTTEFYVLRPQEKVISKWLYYTVSREDFRALAKRSMGGAVGQQRVSKTMIENFEVPIISIPGQHLIVSAIETQFTRLDEAVKSLKIVKKKIEIYRKVVLKATFSGDSWEYSKIGKIFKTSSGGTPSRANKSYYTGDTPWLKSGELMDKTNIENSEEHISKEALEKSSAKIFPIDTTLIAMYGATTGKIGIIKKECSTNQAICGIFPNQESISKFIFYYLLFKRERIVNQSRGGAQPNINQEIIKNLDFPLLSKNIQQKIVQEIESKFSVIDKVEEIVNQSLIKAEGLRKSILKSAFEGKLITEKEIASK